MRNFEDADARPGITPRPQYRRHRTQIWIAPAYVAGVLWMCPVASAQPIEQPAAAHARWTTLGTNSGPIPMAERMEPANLLRAGDTLVLVDAGDGASEQLARAGVSLTALHDVILSHLHFDHTAGLFAILAERYQMLAPGVLTVYGPPGTKATIAGMIAAMAPAPAAGPRLTAGAGDTVKVVEIGDGSVFAIGPVHVRVAANSHYAATPGGERHVSLSFRFDTPGRSIAYTGDTGPSGAVVALARGADLLVSEILDPEPTIARLRRGRGDVPDAAWAQVRVHFEREHLSPAAAGQLAAAAGVKALVLTHDASPPADAEAMRPAVAAAYHGPIAFARDLDSF